MSKKRKAPKFNAAAAYAADPDDESMGQDQSSSGPSASAPTDPSDPSGGAQSGGDPSSQSGQPLTFPAEQVAQMEQLKQSGDMASLGQYVAQYLP